MKILLEVITGSRLHGLHTEKSDIDYRGIFINDLNDVLSPFKKTKTNCWIEGAGEEDTDNTAYELSHFIQMASKGNPSTLEVLWSNQIHATTPEADELRANRHKLLDSKYIFEAHKGYSHNQYTKMNLFTPDARTPKFAVAYVRVLQQGIELLSTGEFSPQVLRNRDFLYEVKNDFNPIKHQPVLTKMFADLQVEFAEAYQKNHNRFTPDKEWLEAFIYKTYTKGI